MSGLRLNHTGQEIVRRGGADGQSDDDMLVLEIINRMPGMNHADYQEVFIALMEAYGEDALAALRSGAVKIEKQSTRDMQEPRRDQTGGE